MIEASEEQRMIRDTAARLVAEATAAGPPAQRDMDAATWAIAVESGWSALSLAEDDGGLGGGAVELGILAEELGRGLLLGDWLLGSVLCARLVAAAPGGALRAALLARIAAGERSIAPADGEPASRGAGDAVRLQARVDGDGWTLTGAKRGAWVRDETRELLVTARASRDSLGGASTDHSPAAGGPADRGGDAELLIAVVPRSAPGLALREYDTVDAGRALDLGFDGVRVPAAAILWGPSTEVAAARTQAWNSVLLASAAECVGMIAALQARTAEYLGARKQFGQPLARQQVLRHRMADVALAGLRARALTAHLEQVFAAIAPTERTRMASAAIVKALEGVRYAAEQAVQLHGGMGVSAELPIGRYLRRVLALEATLGSADYHRARYLAALDA